MNAKPVCQTGRSWVRARLGVSALAPLTGQDQSALAAFFHLVALYGNSDAGGQRSALLAMAYTVRAMQPSTRHIAKAGIPAVLDWSDEERIWQQLESLAAEVALA